MSLGWAALLTRASVSTRGSFNFLLEALLRQQQFEQFRCSDWARKEGITTRMLSAVGSSICARSICPFMLYLRATGWKYLPQVFRSWRKKKVRTASSTAQMGASFSCLMRHEPQGSSRLASRENHCRLASIICWQHVSNWLNFLKRWSNSTPPTARSCRVPLAIFF